MSGEAIRVAVRVRPFAGYEKQKGAKNIVTMVNGRQTCVEDPSSGKKKSFTFDYSFNSHVDSSIIDFKGKQVGELTCELIAISIDFNDGHRKSIKLIDNFEEFQLKNFIGGTLNLESEFLLIIIITLYIHLTFLILNY